MINLEPIGVIRSPYTSQGDAPRQGRGSQVPVLIDIYPRYGEGLDSLEGISYIWVLYWMDRAERNLLRVQREDWDYPKPVFCIRSPARPNPIALSIGKVVGLEGTTVTVTGIEALDGSPVLDIKPWVRDLDCIPPE